MPMNKERLIQELLIEVENRYALQPSQTLINKISSIFEKLPIEALTEWIGLLKTLSSDHPEWQSFVEGLMVHETYFCRDRNVLNGIRNFIFPKLFEKNRHKREINIWSAACSTGEEAYNLGILCLEALHNFLDTKIGMNEQFAMTHGWTINVLATDLSKQVLRIAETGIYNDSIMGSFRSSYNEIMPFFTIDKAEPNANGEIVTSYQVKPFIRSLIKFRQFNLLSENPPQRNFDLIVCRNVLIYFNDHNKMKVQEMLDKALVSNGALVLGTVDTFYLEHYKKTLEAGCLWYEKVDEMSIKNTSSHSHTDHHLPRRHLTGITSVWKKHIPSSDDQKDGDK